MSEWRACGRERTSGGVGVGLPRRRSVFPVACLCFGRERGGARVVPCVLDGGCECVAV